jgi:hypothetical protein
MVFSGLSPTEIWDFPPLGFCFFWLRGSGGLGENGCLFHGLDRSPFVAASVSGDALGGPEG